MGSGVLFVHNGFPGQFRDLAQTLVARGVPCAAIGGLEAQGLEGVNTARYAIPRASTPGVYPLAMAAEGDFIRASMASRVAHELKGGGFDPAVIVGHAMWGEMAFMAEIFPEARQVLFPELFSGRPRPAAPFDPEFQSSSMQTQLLAKSRWAAPALELCDADAIVAPTPFQAATLPAAFRPITRIIHEGIDVETIRPGSPKPLQLPGGTVIRPGTPVITHVNNYLEPLRGLHILARALPRVLAEVPEAQVLIVGRETLTSAYAGDAPGGGTWKEAALAGVELDPARVHFLGWLAHPVMHEVLKLSTAHVYYTWPYVLSWSVVEVMALGCYVIGSDTAPVRDAIEDGVNGRLLPFFDVDALAATLIEACRQPEASRPMREAARSTAVERFSQAKGRAAWLELLSEMGLEVPAAA
ncbi:glycosyltransferase [Phenylobacterium sp.]|jgi:glycosyltransferase involved in cell wall biosynthesis|uniref:glycosyltransferase n=1 Tax=Phenylobacterium sp. TaxID=1871053 RepID=UPI002F93B288